MNKYELLVILSAEQDDASRDALIEKIKTLIEDNKGVISAVDNWGVKKYEYPINYKTQGIYVLFKLELNANVPSIVEKQLNITDNVVRCMFTRV